MEALQALWGKAQTMQPAPSAKPGPSGAAQPLAQAAAGCLPALVQLLQPLQSPHALLGGQGPSQALPACRQLGHSMLGSLAAGLPGLLMGPVVGVQPPAVLGTHLFLLALDQLAHGLPASAVVDAAAFPGAWTCMVAALLSSLGRTARPSCGPGRLWHRGSHSALVAGLRRCLGVCVRPHASGHTTSGSDDRL